MNDDKTEDYEVNRNGDTSWKECKFLGYLSGNEKDIKRRKQLACAAFKTNKSALYSTKISLAGRMRIFVALISSIFLDVSN